MRLTTLFLIAAFAASTVDAASYQKTDGTIVDPIQDRYYSGASLEPSAYLYGANLTSANLTDANLSYADLSGATLTDANLDFADLTNATFSPGTILKDGQTVLQHGFDAAGLQAYLVGSQSASDASNLTIVNPIPEPTTLLLALLALTAVPLRVRHG